MRANQKYGVPGSGFSKDAKFAGSLYKEELAAENKNDQTVFFTYTTWKTERQIEQYRRSETHRKHKEKMKQFYAKDDSAWTVEKI